MAPALSRSIRGFSLIELLVVITIVAILAGLLLPAIGMVKSSAQASFCRNNLRQLNMAALGYANAYSGMTLSPCNYSSWSNTWISNTEFLDLWTEANNSTAFTIPGKLLCPVSKTPTDVTKSRLQVSYGMNKTKDRWSSTFSSGSGPISFNIATAGQLSQLVSFSDALHWHLQTESANPTSGFWSGYWAAGSPSPEGVRQDAAVAYRHRTRANAAFYDGHVQGMAPVDLWVNSLWMR